MERKLRITVGDKTREVTVQELGADGHPLPAAVAVAAIAAAPQRRPLDPKWSTIQRDTNERMSHMLPYLTRGSKVFQPADVRAVRATLGVSQSEFALMIGVSVATLRNWEQGRRTPEGPALALLRVAARNPRAVAEALHGRSAA